MCGIAGYNASPEWVATHINEEIQFNILEQSWLHNEHRGGDAAGYFRVDATDLKPYQRKSAGTASDQLKEHWEAEGPRAIGSSLVFGAHTRFTTLGSEKNNKNNHPVEYEDVLVTHNGTIGNHSTLMNLIPFNLKATVGEVDTTAIAVALNDVTNPWDIEQLQKNLSRLEGSMAIHAVWKSTPGLSLLAKSRHSPLIMRIHPDGFVAYASVDEANYATIEAMGMDPNDEAWECREMSDYSFLLLEDGVPVRWGTYRDTGWRPTNALLKHNVLRLKGGLTENKIYETDNSKHWAADAKDRSLKAARKAGKTKLIYTAKQGFRGSRKKLEAPFVSTVKPWDKITEADTVYENEDASVLYAKFGGVEIVIDADTSKLLDVYNHEKYAEVVRRIEVDKEPDVQYASLDEWLQHATRGTVGKVKTSLEPRYTRQMPSNPMRGVRKAQNVSSRPKPATPAKLTLISSNGICEVDWPEPEVIDLGLEVTWQNLDNYTQSVHAPMAFLSDIKCDVHQQLYSEHKNPVECDQTVLASIAFASSIMDITLWYNIDPSIEVVERPAKADMKCTWQKGNFCEYEPYLHRQVCIGANSNGQDEVVEVLQGEMCVKCGSKLFVRRLPIYMEDWTGDKRYVS